MRLVLTCRQRRYYLSAEAEQEYEQEVKPFQLHAEDAVFFQYLNLQINTPGMARISAHLSMEIW